MPKCLVSASSRSGGGLIVSASSHWTAWTTNDTNTMHSAPRTAPLCTGQGRAPRLTRPGRRISATIPLPFYRLRRPSLISRFFELNGPYVSFFPTDFVTPEHQKIPATEKVFTRLRPRSAQASPDHKLETAPRLTSSSEHPHLLMAAPMDWLCPYVCVLATVRNTSVWALCI